MKNELNTQLKTYMLILYLLITYCMDGNIHTAIPLEIEAQVTREKESSLGME